MSLSKKARRRRAVVAAIEISIKTVLGTAFLLGVIAFFCALASLLLRACGVG